MSNISIGSLNYQIAMDSSQLNASATLTKQQMRDVRRVMQETKDPAKVLSEQIDRLDSILKAGAITAEQYAVAVANVHARSPEGIERAAQAEREKAEAARVSLEAERELANARARGEAIMISTLTAEEKYQRTITELDDLLRRAAISQETYNRAAEQSYNRHIGAEKMAAAEREKAEAARVALEAERELAAVRTRGEAIMVSTLTGEEKHQRAISELDELLRRAAISQETYNRATAQSYHRHIGAEKMAAAEKEQAEAAKKAAEAESERNRVMSRGESITQGLMTGEERHIQNLREMRQLLDQNAISQETYNRAIAKSRNDNLPRTRGAGAGVRDAAMSLTGSMPGVTDAVSAFSAAGGGAAALGLAAGLGAVVAAGAGVIHVSNQVREMANHVDAVTDSAARMGMQFSELNTLRISLAETSGLDPASVDSSMQRMMIGLNEAAVSGSGAVFDSLAALGLEAGELLKQGPVEALKQIMDATQGLKNPTDQLAIAYDLFGKQGAGLVSSLRAGKENLEEMKAWMDKTGMNLTQAQAEGIGAANDAWARMQMITTGLYTQLAAEMAPVIQVIAESVMEGSDGFTSIKDYLRPIVDNTVFFAGILYDAWEMSRLLQTTLNNIVTLNWGEVGEDIKSAFDFGTGQRNVEALQAARAQAEAAAKAAEEKKHNEESHLAAIERQREAEKAATAQKIADEKAVAAEQAKQIAERQRLEAEAERTAQQARDRDAAAVDALFQKHLKHYNLQKEVAQLDELRQKGLISQKDHAQFRDELLEKEARSDVQRAQTQTVTRGSAEEYNVMKSAADSEINSQMVEVRKQTVAIELMRDELKLARKHIEQIKQPRTYR